MARLECLTLLAALEQTACVSRTADATRNRWVALLGKYPNLKNDHVYEEKMSSRSRHNRGMHWADMLKATSALKNLLY